MKTKELVYWSFRTVLLLVLSVGMGFPFLWMILTSLKSFDEVYQFPPSLIPSSFHWENYVDIWKMAPLGRYFLNSVFTTGAIIILQLLTIIPAAYAFARLKFKGNSLLFLLVLATMMISIHVTFIPNFLVIKQLGWFDTYLGVIVPFSTKAFGIFLIRQAFMQVPRELEEAAILDGSGHWGRMRHILIPLSASTIVTYVLLCVIWYYNELFWPLIVTNDENLRTVQLGLSRLISEEGGGKGTQWNLVMAAATVVITPLVILFIFMQRFIVKGVATTGLK